MAPHEDMSRLQKESLLFLEETFETHHGIYIDKGTTLVDTLAGITAGGYVSCESGENEVLTATGIRRFVEWRLRRLGGAVERAQRTYTRALAA